MGLINFRPREQKLPVKLGYARPFIGDKRSRRRSSPFAGERVIGKILPPCALAHGKQRGMKWGGNVGKPRDLTRRGGPRKRGSFVPHLRAELDFHPGPRLKLSVQSLPSLSLPALTRSRHRNVVIRSRGDHPGCKCSKAKERQVDLGKRRRRGVRDGF